MGRVCPLRVIINYVTVADQQTVGTRSLSLQLVPRESTVLTPISYSTLTALKRTVAYLNFRIKRGGVNTDTHYQLKEGLTLLGGNLQSTEVWNLVAQVATINNDTLVDAPLEQFDNSRPETAGAVNLFSASHDPSPTFLRIR